MAKHFFFGVIRPDYDVVGGEETQPPHAGRAMPELSLRETASSAGWCACDVTSAAFGAIGDSKHDDTKAIRLALQLCDEVLLSPRARSSSPAH